MGLGSPNRNALHFSSLETASDEWVSAHTSQSVTLADSRLSRDGDGGGGG